MFFARGKYERRRGDGGSTYVGTFIASEVNLAQHFVAIRLKVGGLFSGLPRRYTPRSDVLFSTVIAKRASSM